MKEGKQEEDREEDKEGKAREGETVLNEDVSTTGVNSLARPVKPPHVRN